MVKGRNSESESKTLNSQTSKVTDPFAINSRPLFSLESRHSLPFSENLIMRRFHFMGNSNFAAETGNVQSRWVILVTEWP